MSRRTSQLLQGLYVSRDGLNIVTDTGYKPPLNLYGSVAADLLPATNNAYDIGSSSYRWQDLFVYNLDAAGTISGSYLDVIPDADNTYLLGNASRQWKSLALDDGLGNISIWPGVSPFTTAQGSIYITGNTNNYASATADGQTLVGYGGRVGYAEATALGYFALATQAKTVALGAGTTASADSALAVGYGTSATAANAVALGPNITNSTANTVLLGKAGTHTRFTSAGDHYPTSDNAFDLGANATRWRVLYAGDVQAASATVTGTLTAGSFSGPATALKSATTTVDVSAATAPSAGQILTATSGTAATWQSVSSAVTGLAFGSGTTAATASALESVALGSGAIAGGVSSIALGDNATVAVDGIACIALGFLATCNATSASVVIGYQAIIDVGGAGTCVGPGASITAGVGCVAVGGGTDCSADGAVAVGANVDNNVANTVVLGSLGVEGLRLLDPSVGNHTYRTVTWDSASATPTLLAVNALGGSVTLSNAGAITLTLDTGANLDDHAQLAGNLYIGMTFDCELQSTDATPRAITVSGAAGSTTYGVLTNTGVVKLKFRRTGVDAWAVSVK